MARPERTSAEEAERSKRRKWYAVIGISCVLGFGTGLGFVLGEEGEGFMSGPIPEWLAIGLAALYVAMMIFGTLAMKRVTDEVEIHNNLYGMAMGGSAAVMAYPPWWMLWRGGVAGEPMHEVLFLLIMVAAFGAYLWKKYR